MTIRNRLTNTQRAALVELIEGNPILKISSADSVAELATEQLGFTVTANNVRYISAPEIQEEEGPITERPDYSRINATRANASKRPHELCEYARSVEILERLRRMETMLVRVVDHLGIDRFQSMPPHQGEETQPASNSNSTPSWLKAFKR